MKWKRFKSFLVYQLKNIKKYKKTEKIIICKKNKTQKKRKIKKTTEKLRRKNERKRKEINKVHKCRKAVHNPQINTVMLYQPELGMRDKTQTLCKLSAIP